MRVFNTMAEMKAAVGTELGASGWLLLDQKRIDLFAEATGADSWIHVDVERSKRELPGGRTLLPGVMTYALMHLLSQEVWHNAAASRGLNYGVERMRFPAAVSPGDRIRLRQHLVSFEPYGEGAWKLQLHNVMEKEDSDKPAMVADTLHIHFD